MLGSFHIFLQIFLAGEGTFLKPINLNENDPFLNCLYFSIHKEYVTS